MSAGEPDGDQEVRATGARPLPPSPLAVVTERLPFERVRLPWYVPAEFLVIPAIVAFVVAIPLVWLSPLATVRWLDAWVALSPRYFLAVGGAMLADHLAPSRSRIVRWCIGMGLIGLLPGPEYFLEARPPMQQWLWSWKWWFIAAAVRDAAFGALVAWALQPRRGAWWRVAALGAAVWGVYLLLDWMLGGIMLGGGTAGLAGGVQFAVTAILAAGFAALALAGAVLLAWRRSAEEPVESM